VEPTNNVGERVLRHAVIWRKLCFGTQSGDGSRFVETMLTVIETCRQQRRNLFEYLTAASVTRWVCSWVSGHGRYGRPRRCYHCLARGVAITSGFACKENGQWNSHRSKTELGPGCFAAWWWSQRAAS